MTENSASVKTVVGTAVAVPGNDIDTDRIIPARFLRSITFEGLGKEVFRDERFHDDGSRKEHPLNDQRYDGSSILLVNRNFGCGSSREHAPQAIMRFGIKAIVGESFAEIFAGNCTSIGVPVFTAGAETVRELQKTADQNPETVFTLSLEAESITYNDKKLQLAMTSSAKTALLEGRWNSLDELRMNEDKIDKVYRRLPYINAVT